MKKTGYLASIYVLLGKYYAYWGVGCVRVLAVLMSFLLHLILARNIGVEAYGSVSFVLSLVGILSVMAPIGVPTMAMRYTAAYIGTSDLSALKGLIVFSFVLISFGVFLSIVSLVAINDIVYALGDEYFMRLLSGMVLLYSFIYLVKSLYQGLNWLRPCVCIDELFVPVLVLIMVLLLNPSTLTDVLEIYVVILLVILFFGLIFLYTRFPVDLNSVNPVFNKKEWFRVSMPLMIGGLSQLLLTRSDMVMLGLLSSLYETGIYSVASRLSLVVIFGTSIVNLVVAPRLSSYYHAMQMTDFSSLVVVGVKWSLFLSLPVTIIICYFSDIFIGFFGNDFSGKDSSIILYILCFSQLINASMGPIGSAIIMSVGEKKFAVVVVAVSVINIFGNVFAIPEYGAMGAATVSFVSIVIQSFLLLFIYRRYIVYALK